IRMSDFYPDNVGGQEFCEVTKAVFAELLRFKAIDEDADSIFDDPDNIPTVIIKVKDFYPSTNMKEEYKEISREEFEQMLAKRSEQEAEKENENTVTVRTKDFAPYIKSGKEYVDIDWKTYVAVLRIKSVEDYMVTPESENNTTIEIRLSDFFPNDTFDREYNNISFNIYAELLRMKVLREHRELLTENGNIRIKMSDFYPDYLGDDYAEVSPAVYEQLCIERRAERKNKIKDYRYLEKYGFDEIEIGERQSVFESSAEDSTFREIKYSGLYKALNSIDPLYARRMYLYVGLGMKVKDVAELEGVSHAAILKSVKKGLEEIRPLLFKSDFE
ncbi:MAG: hypothetical protein K6B74_12650, partial [Ruminococcus sp.]|nr:hypothetical protein [Ruminococcus sp.]